MIGRYGDAGALRRALEDRLKHQSRIDGVALDRLRKEAAFARLLARFVDVAPHGWALKGGVSLIWRTGVHVRATRDVDANWRRDVTALEDFLASVEDRDLDDGFEFVVGEGRELQGEGDDGARRFPVRALLAGRDFERFHLDINLVPDDPRPVEAVRVARNPFAFADVEAPTVPMLPAPQQLAEKLHACVREYASGTSSRSKDAFDTVVIAASVPLPDATAVMEAVRATFSFRGALVPSASPPLPAAWHDDLSGLLDDHPLDDVAQDVDQLVERFRSFWNPLLVGEAEGRWAPERWTWGA